VTDVSLTLPRREPRASPDKQRVTWTITDTKVGKARVHGRADLLRASASIELPTGSEHRRMLREAVHDPAQMPQKPTLSLRRVERNRFSLIAPQLWSRW
jgi:hypothetical protein